jgi:glycosyltransferase involved in cell wall biosynthesis
MPIAKNLISIVIPAFQADSYLPETLQGISNQCETAWELILVEDGSQGATEELVAQFAAKHGDHRVAYENSDINRGQACALNRGIALARGNFIALLDADDIWLPDHLASSVAAIEEENGDIAFSTSILFESSSGKQYGYWGPAPGPITDVQAELARNSVITPSATLLRRDLFDRIGGFDEDPTISSVQDYDFWLRAAIHGAKFVHVNGHHCLYRKGHDEAATKQLETLNYKIARVLDRHIAQLHDLDDRQRDRLLARRLLIAGIHNIRSNTDFAREALHRAWKLERSRPLYALAYMASYSPKTLYTIRQLASPWRSSIQGWLSEKPK